MLTTGNLLREAAGMRLSVQEQLLPGDGLAAKWDFARSAGFDGIELRGAGDGGLAARLPELRAAARAGAVLATVCPEMDHFIGDFDAERRRDAVAQMKSQLSVIAELGGDGVLTPASWGMFSLRLPPFTPPRPPGEDRRVLLEGLGELAAHAEAEGVWIALEPLNRYEDHMVNTVAQAAELTTGAGPAAGVCADVYHMNIEEDDPPAALVAAGARLRHVHVCDTNRFQPGAGHLDFAATFAALAKAGYDGWLGLECRLRGEPSVVLPETAALLREHLEAAGVVA
jgi:sugar phosphate isomerase/epimerase